MKNLGRSSVHVRILILAFILLMAAGLRFFRLGDVPASLNWDETALGYNAYSVLKTGRDEYGVIMPLTLRSFDDYKPPLYMYITVPSVAVFGLNGFAVRLPSAVMGTFAVLGTYFLTRAIMQLATENGKRNPAGLPDPDVVGLAASFLLAISPWHVHFSRIAFEANTGVTLNIWLVYFLLTGIASRSVAKMTVSAVLAGLALYAYHSERIFVPMLLAAITVIFARKLWNMRKKLVIPAVAGIIVVLPMIAVFADPATLTRLRGTSSLADQTGLLQDSVAKLEYDIERGDRVGAFFENRRFVWAKTLLGGYLSHFSPRWMFLTGDNPRHHAPDTGLLYLWELPFLIAGMALAARFGKRAACVLFAWVFLAPVAASPTTELPHAIRTMVFLPALQIFTAMGFVGFFSMISKRSVYVRTLTYALAISVVSFGIAMYLNLYYGHMDREVSKYWQYGRREAVEYAESVKANYDRVVVSIRLEQPHMFFLFYTRYDPAAYLSRGGTASGGFREAQNRFDAYEFRVIDWEHEVKDGRTLYIGLPGELPGNTLKTIRYLDGTEAVRISEG
jgi:4-amino-4-deoxy-L-arabinose transferase-like glycosyltransferase